MWDFLFPLPVLLERCAGKVPVAPPLCSAGRVQTVSERVPTVSERVPTVSERVPTVSERVPTVRENPGETLASVSNQILKARLDPISYIIAF